MILKKYTTVLFDLDGTLTDPKVGITKSVDYALTKLGIPDNDLEALKKFIGPPLGKSFEVYYGMDKAQADRAVAWYREYYSETGIFENIVYPGIAELLAELKKRGIRLFVATSKPTVFARRVTDHFSLTGYFEAIEGSALDGSLCDKSELIAHILSAHGLSPEKTLMVGDREHDIIGAKNNQLDSVGVGYGYGSAGELTRAGATCFANTMYDLSELLLDDDDTAAR